MDHPSRSPRELDPGAADPRPRDELPSGLEFVAARGFFDGEWYTEEDHRASRLGIRVRRTLHEETTPYQRIAVYETFNFGRLLTLDDLVMLTERDEFVYHEMLIHVPLLSMPAPRAVLIIGGGDCGAVREALKHPSIERVVLCEIDERVTRVSEEWFPWVTEIIDDPRVELVFNDGAAYVRDHEGAFDLIVVDSTDPIGPAVGLFLREFFGKVRGALADGGVLCAQTESPHWDAGMVGTIMAELRSVFRHVHPYLGWIPTYPSGCWSWTYASNDRGPHDHFDEERARRIAESCLYYNPSLQTAAFALPTFARRACDGENVFERFER